MYRTRTERLPRLLLRGLALGLLLGLWVRPAAAFNLDLNKLGNIVQKVVEGKDAFVEVGESREIDLGRQLSARLLGATRAVDDPELQAYVNRVGLWLALHSDRPGLPWHFGVLDSESVNAFAAPGGFVFITKGLLRMMNNEAELAGVLAHEITHVTRRHHLVAIQSTARTKLAADVVSTMVSENGALSDAVVGVGMELWAKGLDREDELDADARALVVAARGGYEPYGLVAVLEALAARESDEALALMVSTHPSAVQRLDALDRALDARFVHLSDLRTVDDRFARMKARLR